MNINCYRFKHEEKMKKILYLIKNPSKDWYNDIIIKCSYLYL